MITAPEYSFVQFYDSLNDCCCTVPLEVAEASDLSFYASSDNITRFCLCDVSGYILTEMDIQNGWISPNIDLSQYLACDDCFRFLIIDNNVNYYSNIFQYNRKLYNIIEK